jgi:transposase
VIQITPQMRILVAVDPIDFRRGIDGIARLCRDVLESDPFAGWLFVFRNRRATAIKILTYDSQGFWLAHKRLSAGHFRWWPSHASETAASLDAHQLQRLIMGGDPAAHDAAPVWRRVRTG